jgi:hypothetical protein
MSAVTTVATGTVASARYEPFGAFDEVVSGEPCAQVAWLRTEAAGEGMLYAGMSASSRRRSATRSPVTSPSTSSQAPSRSRSTGARPLHSPQARSRRSPRERTRPGRSTRR